MSDTKAVTSKILNDSQTDFIYFWNATGQAWISYANTGAGNNNYDIEY